MLVLVLEQAQVRVHDARLSEQMDMKAKARLAWELAAMEALALEPKATRAVQVPVLRVMVLHAYTLAAPYEQPH